MNLDFIGSEWGLLEINWIWIARSVKHTDWTFSGMASPASLKREIAAADAKASSRTRCFILWLKMQVVSFCFTLLRPYEMGDESHDLTFSSSWYSILGWRYTQIHPRNNLSEEPQFLTQIGCTFRKKKTKAHGIRFRLPSHVEIKWIWIRYLSVVGVKTCAVNPAFVYFYLNTWSLLLIINLYRTFPTKLPIFIKRMANFGWNFCSGSVPQIKIKGGSNKLKLKHSQASRHLLFRFCQEKVNPSHF